MKTKFNKFERVAGLFVITAVAGAIFSGAIVIVKRGWFSPQVKYVTSFDSADGVHSGTNVIIAGLRAGSVDEVELQDDNKIRVTLSVLKKFQDRIRQDSQAQLIRPFVIGERVLEISVGDPELPLIDEHAYIPSTETIDMMSLFSGRKLGEYLSAMTGMVDNLKALAQAFTDKKRTESLVKTFDQIEPLVKNLNTMSVEVIKLSKQATRSENLGQVLGNLAVTTEELNKLIPEFKEKAPHMTSDISKIVENLAVLTDNFKLLTPALAEIAPDLPRTSRRAVEALDEAVVLLKAMQRSMFLKGNVDDVREEEDGERRPASK